MVWMVQLIVFIRMPNSVLEDNLPVRNNTRNDRITLSCLIYKRVTCNGSREIDTDK